MTNLRWQPSFSIGIRLKQCSKNIAVANRVRALQQYPHPPSRLSRLGKWPKSQKYFEALCAKKSKRVKERKASTSSAQGLRKSPGGTTDNAKTNEVVGYARVVGVAIGRTAIHRIVVPGTAASHPT